MPLFDLLKALASQLIVLHHLALYGPVGDSLQRAVPALSAWLIDYARLAVQVFLVIGGFFAAKSLAPQGTAAVGNPLAQIMKRYLRLAMPFAVAVGLAIVAAVLARLWLDDDMVPERPRFLQVLAHLVFLHGIVGADSLSAGVWYVAIDLQLFALMVLLLWASGRVGVAAAVPAVIGVVAAVSLYYFNLDAGWDNWAIYFFGAYALGALAFWLSARTRSVLWFLLVAAVVAGALCVDFRARIAVAAVTAFLLWMSRRSGLIGKWPEFRPVAFLGGISYSVFLVHFPVLLVANALGDRFFPESTGAGLIAGLLAWAASIAAGAVFHRYVESAPVPSPGQLWRVSSRLPARLFGVRRV